MSEAAAGAEKSSNLVKIIVTVLIVVLVPSIGGILAYKLYLAPAIAPPSVEEKKPEAEEGKKGEEAAHGKKKEEHDNSPIPKTAVGFDLPEQQVAVKAEANQPAAILVYACAIICENEEIKKEVEERKQWFIAEISRLYRNRSVDELNNPEIQQAILDQAKEGCNAIMRRFAMEDPKKKKKAEEEEKDEIVAVLSTKYSVFIP